MKYKNENRQVTIELITEMLSDKTKTDCMGSGYNKESNNNLERVRGMYHNLTRGNMFSHSEAVKEITKIMIDDKKQ